jgi:hypothetical protein
MDGTIRGGSGVWRRNNGARSGIIDDHITGRACWGECVHRRRDRSRGTKVDDLSIF